MFTILSTCKGGGYECARTDPPHPKANSKGLYPLHRVLMENKVGRILGYNELVHHKDENKYNNRLTNLELQSRSQHSSHHNPVKKLVKFRCGFCKKVCEVKPHIYRRRKKLSKTGLFCSQRCGSLKKKPKVKRY